MSNDKGLQDSNVRIGTKQTLKMVEHGKAIEVYVAEDADSRVTSKVIALCEKKGVKLTYVSTMRELGKACGIEVGAAMVAVVEGNE
ncbi:ribosomal L7Ae/L30e/S12e/Gadd45 family protein [Paenibacillus apiarius]|uniref:Ribosomal L7Ae/L30e/S12e/Gadd45 family protein n=1 Tax=Paenibacillus apiarius TaxID=46240 RepID=A0ABT4DTM5_9BACL|nr:ribosomal L7Ae/L30e/S12e/Gadd45 family protein [Paenibacillus apiarius]MBN3523756.1 ribosomal L7Ae/L30e/S12e/Gadd45 family protein [Paenibacillus apiarius]MCY9516260.1 ribosomal L7Ae/L30e/S12e/Gadd45 family protein [Paenibacillus apiarius]MCY9520687.1 ribosomal L7Ae/L30e/S12e/Gadd45 family protein [Paenibacillus apiarius]MCY9552542.1 ribosomal L7Ae/L30e/S12e/Gadd45 family protein [Paenibacillus apiarius]MCY9560984.1 ribosomal L7Ae/L30e/S12e/Gadd45 family protein [Paenibacillus apiarius]